MPATRLCQLDEIPIPGSKGFEVSKHSLFVVRSDSGTYLYLNSCPHIGVELNWNPDQFLNMEETLIQCANHGAMFVIESGECVMGPCTGQRLVPVPFWIEDGVVWVELGD